MADMGILSSLGIGSGVLNYDVIDKLKKADEELMVKPLEDKLDLFKKRETALSQFITIGSTVKGDINNIADGTLFAKVSTNVNGSSVSVTANDGVLPQNFSIDVEKLAQNDVYESKGFKNLDTIVNNTGSEQKIELSINGLSTSITLKKDATLSDLKDAINNSNAGVTASIIDTGIGDNPYKLVIKSNETGVDNKIEFNFSNIDDLGFNAIDYTSKTYSADTDKVNESGADQTFKITVNGTDYSMNVADGTTVKDFIDALNNGDLKDSKGNSLKVNAKYDNGAIKFDIQAVGDITIDDTGLNTAFNDNTTFDNANHLQKAQDSLFKYNGVEVSRSSNKIEDLITGVTINLNSTGKSTVNITQNVDDIVKAIKQFVADYNSMISNLQNLTAFNKDTGNVGLFQGNSDFTMLSSKFNNDLFSTVMSNSVTKKDRNGFDYDVNTTVTAADFGFDLNKTGMISFNEEKFKNMLKQNPDLTSRFMSTAFTKLKTDFETNITGDKSNLNLLDEQIKDEEKNYQDRIDAMNKYLDIKYEIMAKQFAAYDEAINKLNTQSKSLQMTIEQAINSKK